MACGENESTPETSTPMSKHERAALAISLGALSGIATAAVLRRGEKIDNYVPEEVELHYSSENEGITVKGDAYLHGLDPAIMTDASAWRVSELLASGDYSVESILIDGERVRY